MTMLILAFIIFLINLFLGVKKSSLPVFFISLTVIILFLGQAYYIQPLDNTRVSILHEFGFGRKSYLLALAYLIFLGFGILAFTLSHKPIGSTNIFISSNACKRLDFRLLLMTLCAFVIYILIIGFDGLRSVRPNLIRGGTFGTILVLISSLLSLIPICLRNYSFVSILNILINIILLTASGTRIFVIYFFFTLGSVLLKTSVISFSKKLILPSIFISFLILIVGQSFKEFFGGNIEFDSIIDAIQFTIGTFYISNTEAFVSLASVIEYSLSSNPLAFNFGISFFGGIKLLIPGFLKSFLDLSSLNLRFYNYSIIPSAPNDFYQSFHIFGVLIHIFLILFVVKKYSYWQTKFLNTPRHIIDFIEGMYIVGVACVILTRGPFDLFIFNVIPVFLILKFIRLWIFSGIKFQINP